MPSQIRNTADLRVMLLDTIERLRNGEIDSSQASSIAKLASVVLRSAKLDLDYQWFQEATGDNPDNAPVTLVEAPIRNRLANDTKQNGHRFNGELTSEGILGR